MIRVHQKNKRIATESSVEEFETREKATKSSKVMIRTDACEDCGEEKTPKRSSASSAALRILQSGANSSRMLRDKLSRKGYSQEEIEEALDEVKTAGLVDDRRLLFAHAEYLAARKFYGRRRVYMELVRKFDRSLVDTYFEEALAEIDFSSYCSALAQKNRDKGKDALIAKLSRQGYTASEIRSALSILSSEQGDDYT